MTIWFSADWHLGHKNIVNGISKWKDQIACRDFETLKDHDALIINTINKYVKEDDVLYLIGDFIMGGRENVFKYRAMINCRNIHFCLGNHDLHIRKNSLSAHGIPAQSLFLSVQDIIFKKIGKTDFTMCHYAFRTWNKGSREAIMLHGHSHNNLPPYEKLLQIADDPCLVKTGELFRQMDVGLESAKALTGEWRPFHIDEIREIMNGRINLNVDDH